MIEVHEQVDVPAAPDAVWALLSNPHEVVDCVPGASLGEEHEDGSFDGTLMVKFGPARVTFKARTTLELDPETKSGNVTARGKDNQGGTRFSTTMHFRVVEQPEAAGSSIPVDAQVEISGKLAMLVEGGAKFVIKRLTEQFSERLAARLTGAPPVAAAAE